MCWKTTVNDSQKLESTRLASHVRTHVRIRQAEDNSGFDQLTLDGSAIAAGCTTILTEVFAGDIDRPWDPNC